MSQELIPAWKQKLSKHSDLLLVEILFFGNLPEPQLIKSRRKNISIWSDEFQDALYNQIINCLYAGADNLAI